MTRYANLFGPSFCRFTVYFTALLVAFGCSSSRETTKQAFSEQESTEKVEFAADSCSKSTKTTTKVRESEQSSGDFSGIVSVTCDSAGGIKGISWEIRTVRQNAREGTYSRDQDEHAASGSSSVQLSQNKVSGAKEAEKTETHVEATIPLELKIGVAIIVILLLYLCYKRFKPWIKLILP